MTKLLSMRDAIAEHVPDGCSVALGLQLEQMIPFAAGHEIIRQRRRGLTLIGPISDILFDQLIGAGCVERVIAAWVGNVMMGSAYNFRRAVEDENPGSPGRKLAVTNMTNFSIALALQAAAMGVPFLPTRTALGSDVAKDNEFFAEIASPFEVAAELRSALPAGAGLPSPASRSHVNPDKLHAVRALTPDVAIVHVQRADENGNAHCWGNFGVMLEAVRAARRVIVVAEEIIAPEMIASDPNRTIIPGFMVSAVVESPGGALPSPVQGYYKRDDAFFRHYHEQTKTAADSARWLERWVYGVGDRAAYLEQLGDCRFAELKTKQHAYAAVADFGY
jgi:glutaconate CoA-transferase subunit A